MVGWHDSRRERFFNSLRPGIYVDRTAVDQVLIADDVVSIREGSEISAERVRPQLENLDPHDRGEPGRIYFGRQTGHGCAAAEAVNTFPDDLDLSYVLISQQRVQPGNDPEHGAPLPRLPENSELGQGVKIAVVDTGVADQKGACDVWSQPLPHDQWDELHDVRPGAQDKLAWAAGHATFIASLIRQVAPAAEILPIRACSRMGYETEDDVAHGIDRAVATGAKIINLSWCSYAFVEERDDEGNPTKYREPRKLRQAIDRAVAEDVVVVAAAGNSASPDPMYPAAWTDVLAVAALDRTGRRWEHSNYGTWVDASAIGKDLSGVYVRGEENPDNDPDGHAEVWDDEDINYATWTGTSFAAPLVAAQIAVVSAGFDCPPLEAKELLLKTSRDAMDTGCGKRIMVDIPGQT